MSLFKTAINKPTRFTKGLSFAEHNEHWNLIGMKKELKEGGKHVKIHFSGSEHTENI
jgi:hypothetical protein